MYLSLRTGKIIYESKEEEQRVKSIINESFAKAVAFACLHDDEFLPMLEDSFGGEQDGKKQSKS